MKKRIHYMTEEEVRPEEVELLTEIIRKEYAEKNSDGKEMPLWKKGRILNCLTPTDALWGHVGVDGEGEVEVALRALERMSEAVPRLTWILHDENKIWGGEIFLRAGKFLDKEGSIGREKSLGDFPIWRRIYFRK